MTADDAKPAPDKRPVWWLATKPNGGPEMGRAASVKDVPARADWWCRGKDEFWTRRVAVPALVSRSSP